MNSNYHEEQELPDETRRQYLNAKCKALILTVVGYDCQLNLAHASDTFSADQKAAYDETRRWIKAMISHCRELKANPKEPENWPEASQVVRSLVEDF